MIFTIMRVCTCGVVSTSTYTYLRFINSAYPKIAAKVTTAWPWYCQINTCGFRLSISVSKLGIQGLIIRITYFRYLILIELEK